MPRFHHVIVLLLLAGLSLRSWLAGRPPTRELATPCSHPYLLDVDGETRVVCGGGSVVDARELLRRVAHRCQQEAPALRLVVGDGLAVDRACHGLRVRTRGARRLLLGLPVDVNRADIAELRVLPRIGPKLARRIVRERTRGGLFRSLAELAPRVRGIGPKTVHRLRGLAAAGSEVPGQIGGGHVPRR